LIDTSIMRGGENDLTHPLSQIPGYATAGMTWLIGRWFTESTR